MTAIIILFITDIDERFYRLISVLYPSWIKKLKERKNTQTAELIPDIEFETKNDDALDSKVENLEKEIKELKKLVERLTKGAPEYATKAQDSGAVNDGPRHPSIENGDQSSLFMSEANIGNKRQTWQAPDAGRQRHSLHKLLSQT